MPERRQHSRQRGAKLPEGCKLVTRATRWGNPFHVPDIMRAGYGNWSHPYPPPRTDWTITNPPFRLAEQFIERAFQTSRLPTSAGLPS